MTKPNGKVKYHLFSKREYVDADGVMHLKFSFWLRGKVSQLRLKLAYLLAPHLKRLQDREEWNRQDRISLYREWHKDVRGKEKGIRSLQKRVKFLQKQNYFLRRAADYVVSDHCGQKDCECCNDFVETVKHLSAKADAVNLE